MSQSEQQKWHQMPNNNRGAMTVDEFCSWASIGRSKFYQEVAEGRIAIRKIGRKSVVTLSDAMTWLDSLPHGGRS